MTRSIFYVSVLDSILSCVFFLFFFFKQKTAYEMRISDWSSACALPIWRDQAGGDARRGGAGNPCRHRTLRLCVRAGTFGAGDRGCGAGAEDIDRADQSGIRVAQPGAGGDIEIGRAHV